MNREKFEPNVVVAIETLGINVDIYKVCLWNFGLITFHLKMFIQVKVKARTNKYALRISFSFSWTFFD